MKIIKILSVVLAIVLLSLTIAGCKNESDLQAGYPVTVGGAEISKSPETVAVLTEQAASAICALGYKSYLAGAPSEFLETEMEGVSDLGSTMNIDFEAIYELAPDVLISWIDLEDAVKENLIARDIDLVILETPMKYEDIAPYYEALSKLFLGDEKYTEAYEPYISETERIINETAESLKGVSAKALLYIEEGLIATGDTLAGAAIKKAGFTNVAEDEENGMMSFVDIKAADPDVIFCPANMADSILENENFKDITAVKNAAVYEVDVEALLYASEGFAATLQGMSKYLLQ